MIVSDVFQFLSRTVSPQWGPSFFPCVSLSSAPPSSHSWEWWVLHILLQSPFPSQLVEQNLATTGKTFFFVCSTWDKSFLLIAQWNNITGYTIVYTCFLSISFAVTVSFASWDCSSSEKLKKFSFISSCIWTGEKKTNMNNWCLYDTKIYKIMRLNLTVHIDFPGKSQISMIEPQICHASNRK